MTWQANILTIFPEAFPGSLSVSIIGKALQEKKWHLNLVDLKKFPVKSDRIDSPPSGGGAGMLLSPIAFQNAFNSMSDIEKKQRKIYFSPRGRQLNQVDIQSISNSDGITMLCGRYEGVDQRILDIYEFEEVSIGDFVLLGGEVAAMAIVEASVRLLPGVVGDPESIKNDSFQNCLLEHNQYTTPNSFLNHCVPDVLISGHHKNIETYKLNESKILTMEKKQKLWAQYVSYCMNCVKK